MADYYTKLYTKKLDSLPKMMSVLQKKSQKYKITDDKHPIILAPQRAL